MFYVGIDIAKNIHVASIVDEKAKVVSSPFSFSNSMEGLDEFMEYLEFFRIDTSNSIIGMEATGHYWNCLYSQLIEKGFKVDVINPIQSSAFNKIDIRKVKNDTKDSVAIARLLHYGNYSKSLIATEEMSSLRSLTRHRVSLIKDRSCWKKRLKAHLAQAFPEYEKLFSDIYGKASMELLSKYPLPDDILSISEKDLAVFLKKHSRGAFSVDKARQIQNAAMNSFGVKISKSSLSFMIKQTVETIRFLSEQIEEIEKEISEKVSELCPLITTITGIGDILGASIIAEIGDISRFNRPEQLVAYAGLDVSVSQSGDFSASKSTMTKRGCPYLRRSIWLAAQTAAFKDPALSAYYAGLRARGKPHKVSISAVARKLTRIIFAVLRDKKAYVPHI